MGAFGSGSMCPPRERYTKCVSPKSPPPSHTSMTASLESEIAVLEEGERHLVSGLCGRIWTLARDYPQLEGPEAFRAWEGKGTVRVCFAHCALPTLS